MRSSTPIIMLFLLFTSVFQSLYAGDTLRIASYNLLNFPGSDVALRVPYFRSVVHSIKPDILIVQEMTSQSGVTTFLNNVMNYYNSNQYNTIPFHDGPDTDNEIFYKSTRVALVRASYIPTALREIAEYVLHVIGTNDTLRIYSLHLKASAGGDNEQKRLAEATILRNYLNSLSAGSHFMIVGDYNIYRSSEPAFQKLIGSEQDNDGQARDPLNAVGDWTNNATFRFIHTQSPRVRSFGGGSTGGLDDRFDIMLMSYSMADNLITSSYTAYGNDGNHFNDSINRLPNNAVPDSVANALHYAADHLPIFADFKFNDNPTTTSIKVNSGWNLIAVPLIPGDARKNILFPTAISNAYAYGGAIGYFKTDTLNDGKGYWIKFDSEQTVTVSGRVKVSDTVDIAAGWNIVCSMKDASPISQVFPDPPGIIQSKFYGFTHGYTIEDSLRPGKGYWIKSSSPGKLVLSNP